MYLLNKIKYINLHSNMEQAAGKHTGCRLSLFLCTGYGCIVYIYGMYCGLYVWYMYSMFMHGMCSICVTCVVCMCIYTFVMDIYLYLKYVCIYICDRCE